MTQIATAGAGSDARLHDALLEVASLRARSERMRVASEALVDALELLVSERDEARLCQGILERLGRVLHTGDVAIISCDPTSGTSVSGTQASQGFQQLMATRGLLEHLISEPQHTLTDLAGLASTLDLVLPPEVPAVLTCARVRFDGHCWLIAAAGSSQLADAEAQTLFRRFLPVFGHTLQRLIEGRRTDELARREHEILLAKEKAEAASRAKSEFVSRMSHELRTPLNAIIGFAQLLREEPLSHSQRNYVTMIGDAGDHLLDLINTVLDHAKIEAGKLALESIVFDLRQLVDGVATMVVQQASAKGLIFDAVLADDLPGHIVGDPTRLRQILLNLLANAVKFTDTGSVTLRMAADADILYFSVRDTGVGMDKATRASLFQPFAQADESIARKFGGTGLGLMIARDLLQAMGGNIDVDSAPGDGTCFWGHLPLRLPEAETSRQPAETAAATPGIRIADDRNGLAGLRVLVVDDNAINRRLATAMLARFDIVVDTANDGREGLERISAGQYDLILMDVEMPEMDGLHATRALRALEKAEGRPTLPVVALTANAMQEDRDRCLAAGMNGYIAKPIVVAQLQAELVRLTRR